MTCDFNVLIIILQSVFKNSVLRGLQVNNFENILGGTKKNEAEESNFEHEKCTLKEFFSPQNFLT